MWPINAGQCEMALQDFASQVQRDQALLLVRPVARSTIDEPHFARSLLDGPFIREELERMVEYPDDPNRMVQDRFRRLLQTKRGQNIASLDHEVPMDSFGRRMLLNHEAMTHHPLSPPSPGGFRRYIAVPWRSGRFFEEFHRTDNIVARRRELSYDIAVIYQEPGEPTGG